MSSPEPATEVTACPGCGHALRVPLDMLGERVQCPECKAMFQAPRRDTEGKLTAPELVPASTRKRGKADPMLLFPAFGLLFVGFAALGVNGVNAVRYIVDADSAKADILIIASQFRKSGLLTDGPENPAEREKFDDDRAAQLAPTIRRTVPVFAVVSAVVFTGGVAMATRRGYRLAQLACVLAAVNVPNGCCFPGAAAGLWGLLMLNSAEGRAHFGR